MHGRTYGCETETLHFPLDVASVKIAHYVVVSIVIRRMPRKLLVILCYLHYLSEHRETVTAHCIIHIRFSSQQYSYTVCNKFDMT